MSNSDEINKNVPTEMAVEILKTPKPRGFAAMSVEKRTEIARKGGASVPTNKRSFSQSRDLAQSAGSKGGKASHGGGRKTQEKPE